VRDVTHFALYSALARVIGEVCRCCARYVNVREGSRGYLWQGGFSSSVMDERYLLAAARYVELNAVWPNRCTARFRHPWASARPHMAGQDDALVKAKPVLDPVNDWPAALARKRAAEVEGPHQPERTGRPLGSERFRKRLERKLGRTLHPQKGGRARKEKP
jgi:putative transposase